MRDFFGDEREVEGGEVFAFGERGPAVYSEGGLGRYEGEEGVLRATEEACGLGFGGLVDEVGEVEGFHYGVVLVSGFNGILGYLLT